MIEHFERPDGLGPANGYSHAVAGVGRLVAVSGQLPVDCDGALIDSSDALTQARQVFTNLAAALRAASASPGDLLRLTFFLLDLADLGAVRTARDEFLAGGPAPASSLVRVAGLVLPRARLEIDALAMTKNVLGKRWRASVTGASDGVSVRSCGLLPPPVTPRI